MKMWYLEQQRIAKPFVKLLPMVFIGPHRSFFTSCLHNRLLIWIIETWCFQHSNRNSQDIKGIKDEPHHKSTQLIGKVSKTLLWNPSVKGGLENCFYGFLVPKQFAEKKIVGQSLQIGGDPHPFTDGFRKKVFGTFPKAAAEQCNAMSLT